MSMTITDLGGKDRGKAAYVFHVYVTLLTLHHFTVVHEMLRFAQDITECRKILFAKSAAPFTNCLSLVIDANSSQYRYFSMSANVAIASWTTNDEDALTRCGHCDNCKRSQDLVEHKDVALFAWRILKVVEAVERMRGRVTLNKLIALVRGNGGGKIDAAVGNGKRKARTEEVVNIDEVAGGVVQLSAEVRTSFWSYS